MTATAGPSGRADPSPAEIRRALDRLDKLTRLLDTAFRVPGTNFRLGLDPVLGVVPGIGDAAAALVSLGLISEARRLGAPRGVLARMAGNLLVDTVVGSIPVAGTVFDAFYKSNLRNMRILRTWLESRAGPVIEGEAKRLS